MHGHDQSIAAVTARFAPQVESMGRRGVQARVSIHGQRFAQVRAVSNLVERRNREAWKLDRGSIDVWGPMQP